jgi:pantetheine-phosphate adenylyltransferase
MYTHLVVGGTFDGLHRGHTSFLARAFAVSKEVTIGLTSEPYIRRFKKNQGVTPYSKRYQALTSWLRRHDLAGRAHIVPLDNKWGPAVLGEFDAIAVTADNKAAALDINTVRVERGLAPLALVEVPLVDAQDHKAISSTRIRKGVIDGEGHLKMPDSLRPELQKPLGVLLSGDLVRESFQNNRDNVIITVGDVTTQSAFLSGVRPALAIVDLIVERRPFQSLEAYKFPKQYEVVHVESGPGFISKEAIGAIVSWSEQIRKRKRVVIVVAGEEDLLGLPAVLHAPLGSIVYYGSPPALGEEGLVEVVVTEEKKQDVAAMLGQFL